MFHVPVWACYYCILLLLCRKLMYLVLCRSVYPPCRELFCHVALKVPLLHILHGKHYFLMS